MKSKHAYLVVVAIVVCISAILIGETTIRKSNNKTGEGLAEYPILESFDDTTIDKQVILDTNDVRVTVTGLSLGGLIGPELDVEVENKTDKEINVGVDRVAVNGIMIDGIFSCSVKDGEKETDSIMLDILSLEKVYLAKIKDIEFNLIVSDATTWDKLSESGLIKLKTSEKWYNQDYNSNGQVLFNEEGLKIVAQGLKNDDYFGHDLLLYIENNTTSDLVIESKDEFINGVRVKGLFSSTVTVGNKAYARVSFSYSSLEQNNITSIEDIALKFNIANLNFDTLLETDTIQVDLKQ